MERTAAAADLARAMATGFVMRALADSARTMSFRCFRTGWGLTDTAWLGRLEPCTASQVPLF